MPKSILFVSVNRRMHTLYAYNVPVSYFVYDCSHSSQLMTLQWLSGQGHNATLSLAATILLINTI